jgi:hypothetical protein
VIPVLVLKRKLLPRILKRSLKSMRKFMLGLLDLPQMSSPFMSCCNLDATYINSVSTEKLNHKHSLLYCQLYYMKRGSFASFLTASFIFPCRFGPWFCEPIVAGLTEDNTPFLSGMDLIGAPVFTDDFVVSGTCTSNLHGMCEAMYRPDMVRSHPHCLLSFRSNFDE